MSRGEWEHTFRAVEIGSQITIQQLQPCTKTANCITELQRRVVTDIESADLEITKEGNSVAIALPAPRTPGAVLQVSKNGQLIFDYVRAT